MNDIRDIKELLEKYYEGASTDADEFRLREYFASNNVAEELRPYRSLFAFRERVKESLYDIEPETVHIKRHLYMRWLYAAAGVAACLAVALFFGRQQPPESVGLCSGTFVMIDGICYDNPALVREYAAETIDRTTEPVGEGATTDILDFLDEPLPSDDFF